VTDMHDLITKLETLDGPDREVDALIAVAADWRPEWLRSHPRYGLRAYGKEVQYTSLPRWSRGSPTYEPPTFTDSIDAALTLVPEGCGYKIVHGPGDVRSTATVLLPAKNGDGSITDPNSWARPIDALSKTPAIALCIASLKALAARENDRG